MIPVFVTALKYPREDEMIDLNKFVWVNTALVCAVKPAVYDSGEDIMTADGMVYRSQDEPALARIKGLSWPTDIEREEQIATQQNALANIRSTNENPTEEDTGA